MTSEPTSPNASPPDVIWMGEVSHSLNDELRQHVAGELLVAYAKHRVLRIIVKQRFSGYVSAPRRKLILAVEVQDTAGSHSDVVKIGDAEEVRGDYDGWQNCAAKHNVNSRMFIAPLMREVGPDRVAILYPDVYQYYFNDGKENEPKELESIVDQSIIRDLPSARSVQRVLSQVYTEAHRCFYRQAAEDETQEKIHQGISASLRLERDNCVLDRWQQEDFKKLRRGAAWLTHGTRTPKEIKPPQYIDPVDFIRWMVARKKYPQMLVGPAHGDLHGRNVIVGVVRGEAEWPAVIDFDKMSNDNLIAWDFAKLELELKCRLFQELLNGDSALKQVKELLKIPAKPSSLKSVNLDGTGGHRVEQRVELMEIMFAIECLLHDWTQQISSLKRAMNPETQYLPEIPADTPLGRALRIIFQIRREAGISLGLERPGRESLWMDEYYFALAIYGVVSAKWHDANDHMAWALLSAGVAAAHISHFPWPPKEDESPIVEESPSYFHLLPWAHVCWEKNQPDPPLEILRAGIEKFPYASALRQQLALSLAQSGVLEHEEQARREIEELATLACIFTDHEMLSRLGRIYKDKADRQHDGIATFKEMLKHKLPSYQHYLAALRHYQIAFEISQHYYPGVNAATLALLVGNESLKTELANQVLGICQNLPIDRNDQVWILATEGEASLLLGRTEQAVRFYRSSLDRILPEETGILDSMYDQLCRLYWALPAGTVQPVIEMLEREGRLQGQQPGPFGNCGRSMTNESA